MTTTLEEHLGHVMAERAARGHRGAKGLFVAAINNDPDLLAQAKGRQAFLASSEGEDIQKRDHVSREHARTLKEVLSHHE